MKKILLSFILVFSLFMLVGCQLTQNPEDPGTNPENPGQPENPEDPEQPENPEDPENPEEPEGIDYIAVIEEELSYIVPEVVTEDLDLITEFEFEDGSYATLSWETSQGRTLKKNGKYTQNLFDEEITLTATIGFDMLEDFHVIDFKVKTLGTEDKDEYLEIIASYLPDYVYLDMELVDRDGTYKSQNIFGNITYKSTRPDVLTDEGKYVNKSKEDQEVEFCFTVKINGITLEGSKVITVEGKKDEYYLARAQEWLTERYANVDQIYDDLELPETDDLGRVKFTWKSSDLSVISNQGILLTFEPEKNATMYAEITCNENKATWEKNFKTYTTTEVIDFIAERMHRDVIQQYNMVVYAYTADNYGYIPFYVQDIALSDLVLSTGANNTNVQYLSGESNKNVKNFKVTTGLIPWNNMGRTQIKKSLDIPGYKYGTAYITVHDTGDAVHSAEWWNELETTNDARQVSWNFTVGDTGIYQHVPLDEVAWHAGDGSARFALNDTGVKYAGPNPEITINEEDHYLYINGQKSKIGVPIISGSSKSEWNGAFANYISPAGLYTCLGENGNYYMGKVHASTYSQNVNKFYVCTSGGNRNSIGIETCINKGVDYNQVMRNTANLVANLLTFFDLDPSRVLQHRNFSGKLCPQVMIENDLWKDFNNVVENEYIIKKYLSDISFKYESNNPDILSNEGKILKAVTTDTTVSYKVTVSFNGQEKTLEKTTVIKPIK